MLSFEPLVAMVESLQERYLEEETKLADIEKRIQRAKYISDLPEQLEKIKARILAHANDTAYVECEQNYDEEIKCKIEMQILKHHVETPDDIRLLKEKIALWEKQFIDLQNQLNGRKNRLDEIAAHVEVIRRSTRGELAENREVWKRYDDIITHSTGKSGVEETPTKAIKKKKDRER